MKVIVGVAPPPGYQSQDNVQNHCSHYPCDQRDNLIRLHQVARMDCILATGSPWILLNVTHNHTVTITWIKQGRIVGQLAVVFGSIKVAKDPEKR